MIRFGSSTYIVHTGGTGGYRSAICVDPNGGRGLVILTNGVQDLDKVVSHLMNGDLSPAAVVPMVGVHVPPEVLSAYVGEYDYLITFTQKATITVTQEDGVLMFESPREFKVKTIAESATTFVDPVQDLRFTFVTDQQGGASRLNVRYPRFGRSAKRAR